MLVSDSTLHWAAHLPTYAPDGRGGGIQSGEKSGIWDASGRYLYTPTTTTSPSPLWVRTDTEAHRVSVEEADPRISAIDAGCAFVPSEGVWRFLGTEGWEVSTGAVPQSLTLSVPEFETPERADSVAIDVGIDLQSPAWVRVSVRGEGGAWHPDTVVWAPVNLGLRLSVPASEIGGHHTAALSVTMLEDSRVSATQTISLEVLPAVIAASTSSSRLRLWSVPAGRSAALFQVRAGVDGPVQVECWDAQGRRLAAWSLNARAGEAIDCRWPEGAPDLPGVRFLRARQGDEVVHHRLVRLR